MALGIVLDSRGQILLGYFPSLVRRGSLVRRRKYLYTDLPSSFSLYFSLRLFEEIGEMLIGNFQRNGFARDLRLLKEILFSITKS